MADPWRCHGSAMAINGSTMAIHGSDMGTAVPYGNPTAVAMTVFVKSFDEGCHGTVMAVGLMNIRS